MKCPRCNGNGSIPYHIADDLFDETNCPLCGGSGEVMTEQEYLQTCNTEQLADVIADFYLLGYTHGHNQMDITSRTKWTEWLKQPHTIKE